MALYTVIMNSVAVTTAQDLVRISSLASSRTYATGLFTGTNTFGNGNTLTIGNKTYTFQTTLTNSNGNIALGANFAASLQNLYDAINLTGTPGTQYAASMTKHTQVSATGVTATAVTVQALAPGEAGNAIATTDTVANGSWAAATLVGGAGTTNSDAPATRPVAAPGFYIREVTVRSDDSETANQVSLGLYVGTSDLGVGTFVTPRSIGAAPAFVGTAIVNLTTAATKAPTDPVLSPFGDLAGEGANWYAADRSEAIYVGPNTSFVLRLETAPAASTNITATVVVEQL